MAIAIRVIPAEHQPDKVDKNETTLKNNGLVDVPV
jgi:hypothetical protein